LRSKLELCQQSGRIDRRHVNLADIRRRALGTEAISLVILFLLIPLALSLLS
jgi:hypothetical protein